MRADGRMDRQKAAHRRFPSFMRTHLKHPTREAAEDEVTDLKGVSLTPGGQNIN